MGRISELRFPVVRKAVGNHRGRLCRDLAAGRRHRVSRAVAAQGVQRTARVGLRSGRSLACDRSAGAQACRAQVAAVAMIEHAFMAFHSDKDHCPTWRPLNGDRYQRPSLGERVELRGAAP